MEKNSWAEQHSQLWTTPKRSTVSPSVSNSALEQPAENVGGNAELSEGQIVEEILRRLEGRGSTTRQTGDSSLKDNLYRVLMKIEECEESVETTFAHLKIKDDKASLQAKLSVLESATAPSKTSSSKDARENDGSVLRHIVDVLKMYGDIETDADTASVLLSIIKDYEKLKRDAIDKNAAVCELEKQVSKQLAFYGDSLIGDRGEVDPAEDWAPWIETPLTFLYEEVSKTLAAVGDPGSCAVVEPFLSNNASQSRGNITVVLNSAMECVERLRLRLSQSPSLDAPIPGRGCAASASEEMPPPPESCFRAAVEALVNSLPPEIVTEFQVDQHAEEGDAELPVAILESVRALVTRRDGGVDKPLFIINSLTRSLRRSFHLCANPDTDSAPLSLSCALQHLEKTVADVLAYPHESPQRESELKREVANSVDELAQLLPASSDGVLPICAGIRIEPPTSNLSEMVQLLKTRFLAWSQRQQRQLLSGAQKRSERDRVLEVVAKYVKDLQSIALEMSSVRVSDGTATEDTTGAATLEVPHCEQDGDNVSAVSVEMQLNNLQDRLRTLKTQYIKVNQDTVSLRSRLEASTQRNTAQAKNLKRAAAAASKLCEVLRIDENSVKEVSRKDADADKSIARDNQTRLSLRVAQDKPSRAKATVEVTEGNLVDALHAIATRVSGDEKLLKQSEVEHQGELAAALAAKYEKEKAAFTEAMKAILLRLAESGRLVKQSLFMLGTDESASDDAVEDAFALLGTSSAEAAPGSTDLEAVERILAALLQKYARWSRRLCETTEDHLVTQQKIVKYFTAIRRFFSAPGEGGDNATRDLDENLIDIDTNLMRSADVILPALDRAIRATEEGRSVATGAVAGDHTMPSDPDARRREAVDNVAALSSSSKSTVLPYDHRLGRLYDMIGRLYTTVTSLQRVRYLAIPSEAKRRTSGDVELTFDDGFDASAYIDLDLDKLVATGAGPSFQPTRFVRQDATSTSSAAASPGSSAGSTTSNDDRILQAATQNLECAQRALKKFSSDHKLGAIIIQKDTDTMQQLLAGMLEKYSELDVEKAFGQDREYLRELYSVLQDRAARQKGCYFFNRVGGEGKCAWASALEQLSTGFNGVIDKLVQRTDLASNYRDLIDDVVDLCAMFVNWSTQHSLPSGYEVPKDVLDDCVREGGAGDGVDAGARGSSSPPPAAAAGKGSLPPMLPRPGALTANPDAAAKPVPSATTTTVRAEAPSTAHVVSHFQHDETVLKVIEQMFRLSQSVSESGVNVSAGGRAPSAGATLAHDEELALLRETIAVADQRAEALTEEKHLIELERDKAQSEAAVARAELRRLRKDAVPLVEATPEAAGSPPRLLADVTTSSRVPPTTTDSIAAEPITPGSSHGAATTTTTNSIDQDCLQELLQYMKVLGHELQYAKSVSQSEERRPSRLSDNLYSAARTTDAPTATGSGEVESFTEEDGSHCEHDDRAEAGHEASPMTRLSRLKELERHLQQEYQTPLVVDAMEPRNRESRRSAGGGQRRYSPSKHRGGDYEVCEGCVHHHGQTLPERLQSPFEQPDPRTPTVPQMERVTDGRSATPRGGRSEPVVARSSASRTRGTSAQRLMGRSAGSQPQPRPDVVSSQLPSRMERPARYEDDRFFDDDIYARSVGSGTVGHSARRPNSAMRAHPLRTSSLTSRAAKAGYDRAVESQPRAAAPPSTSTYASPPLRGVPRGNSNSNTRNNGNGNTRSERVRQTSARSRPREGRAKSPEHFDAALRTVQEAEHQTSQDIHMNTSPQSRNAASSPESANLRSAALRRLAEVVSQTKVKGPGGRYY